jgi:hypothetical protein
MAVAIVEILPTGIWATMSPLAETGILTIFAFAWTMLASRWISYERPWTLFAPDSDFSYVGIENSSLA